MPSSSHNPAAVFFPLLFSSSPTCAKTNTKSFYCHLVSEGLKDRCVYIFFTTFICDDVSMASRKKIMMEKNDFNDFLSDAPAQWPLSPSYALYPSPKHKAHSKDRLSPSPCSQPTRRENTYPQANQVHDVFPHRHQ